MLSSSLTWPCASRRSSSTRRRLDVTARYQGRGCRLLPAGYRRSWKRHYLVSCLFFSDAAPGGRPGLQFVEGEMQRLVAGYCALGAGCAYLLSRPGRQACDIDSAHLRWAQIQATNAQKELPSAYSVAALATNSQKSSAVTLYGNNSRLKVHTRPRLAYPLRCRGN